MLHAACVACMACTCLYMYVWLARAPALRSACLGASAIALPAVACCCLVNRPSHVLVPVYTKLLWCALLQVAGLLAENYLRDITGKQLSLGSSVQQRTQAGCTCTPLDGSKFDVSPPWLLLLLFLPGRCLLHFRLLSAFWFSYCLRLQLLFL